MSTSRLLMIVLSCETDEFEISFARSDVLIFCKISSIIGTSRSAEYIDWNMLRRTLAGSRMNLSSAVTFCSS